MKKRYSLLILLISVLQISAQTVTNTLISGDFSSASYFPLSSSLFITQGDSGYGTWSDPVGGLTLNTSLGKYGLFYSVTGRVAATDCILQAKMKVTAYHDSFVYGDFQPRGLRACTNANNAIEFYSATATTIGMRIRKNGSSVWTGTPCNVGEYWNDALPGLVWHDYQIDVTATSVTFRIDEVIRGVYLGSEVPTEPLNLFASTYFEQGGSGGGQLPVLIQHAELCSVEMSSNVATQDRLSYTLNHLTQCASVSGVSNLLVDSDITIPAEIDVQGVRYRVTMIEPSAFRNQPNIRSITFSTNIVDISWSLFSGCTSLIGFNVEAVHPLYSVTNGVVCSKNGQDLILYPFGRTGAYVVPDCILHIGNGAFRASKVADVTLPSSVQAVGDYAFYTCSQLTAVHFNSGLQTIGMAAFCMTGVTELILPEGLISVGTEAFRYNWSMRYIEMPSTLEFYPNEMASSCGLERILIKPGVKRTGYSIFWGNYNLKEIVLPEGLEELGLYAFDWCGSVTNIVLPSTFSKAYANTFANSPQLKRIVIPEGTPRLSGNTMFYLAVNLGEVQLASTITQLQHTTFAYCSSLSNVMVSAQSQLMDIGKSVFHGCTALTSFSFPTNLQRIGVSAFADCRRMASPYLPASLQNVSDNAFQNCTSFLGIYFDGNMPVQWGAGVLAGIASTVNAYVWDTASGFTTALEGHQVVRLFSSMSGDQVAITGSVPEQIPSTLYLPGFRNGHSITHIAGQAFANASQLRWVMIPTNIVSIACDAFSGCDNLVAFVVYAGNPVYKSEDGVIYSKDGTTLLLCPPGKLAITIPASVTTLASGAFTGCSRLHAIYFQGEPPANLTASLFEDLPIDFSLYCLDESYQGGSLLGKDIRTIVLKIGTEKIAVQSYRALLSDGATQSDLDLVVTNLVNAGYTSTNAVSSYLGQADLIGVDLKLLAQSNNVERFKTDIQIDGFAVTQLSDIDLSSSETTMQAASIRTLRVLSAALEEPAPMVQSLSETISDSSSLSYKPLRIALSFKVKNGITSDEEAMFRFRQALSTRVKAVVMTQLGGTETEIDPAMISYDDDLATVIFSLADDGSKTRFMKVKILPAAE